MPFSDLMKASRHDIMKANRDSGFSYQSPLPLDLFLNKEKERIDQKQRATAKIRLSLSEKSQTTWGESFAYFSCFRVISSLSPILIIFLPASKK